MDDKKKVKDIAAAAAAAAGSSPTPAPAQAPPKDAAPKVVMIDPKERIQKRMFVGGLSAEVTATDLQGRFQSFGKVSGVEIPTNSFTGEPRGFAYLNIDTLGADWNKCK